MANDPEWVQRYREEVGQDPPGWKPSAAARAFDALALTAALLAIVLLGVFVAWLIIG